MKAWCLLGRTEEHHEDVILPDILTKKRGELLIPNHSSYVVPSPQSSISEKFQVLEFEHKIHFSNILSFRIMTLPVTE